MTNTAKNFYALRVYKQLTTPAILNLMLCNRLMKIKPLVDNSARLYKWSRAILGESITNGVLNQTFCRALTAGNTLEEAQKVADGFRKQDVAIILDYCAEGELHSANMQSFLDENSKMFARSAQALCQHQNQMVSIKITALVDMEILKRINDSVLQRNKFWNDNSENGFLTGQKLFSGLQKKYNGISDQQFSTYLKNIYNYQGSAKDFKIDQIDFKVNHMPYYINGRSQLKNSDFVIRLFLPLTPADNKKLQNFSERLDQICQPFANNKNGFKILVDAEQTYVQRAIQVVSQQLQQKYNKDMLYIIPTIQNYLKRSVARTKYEVEIAKRKHLYFGAKLVRGAYLVQQTNIATKNNIENPVVDCFDKTTENYLSSFKTIVEGHSKGEVIVATHNQDTILETAGIHKNANSQLRVSYAQLLGLADHLTFKSKMEGYRVYKYLPWAKVEVMVAYMIRRAQELSQMKYPLDAQFQLLKHQLKLRYVS